MTLIHVVNPNSTVAVTKRIEEAACEIAASPVLGICQAAVQVAVTLAARFSIVTTLPRSVPIVEVLVADYGATLHCRRVRAVNRPVLAFEAAPADARQRLLAEARSALTEDRADATGMSDLAGWLAYEIDAPVIDGVTAAVKLAETLAGAGFRTSKRGAYAFPRSKADDFAGAA